METKGDLTLVLGAAGGFGRAVVNELVSRGRRVRALVRNVDTARSKLGELSKRVELVQGDALDAASVEAAAQGASAIVHAVSVPYDQWDRVHEPALRNVLTAAAREHALVVFPGNVYSLRPVEGKIDESHPEGPVTTKGELRARLEGLLREFAERGDGRALVVRSNTHFGPTVRNKGVDPIFGNALQKKPMQTIVPLDNAYELTFLPDLARATVELLDVEGLQPFEVVNVAGWAEPHRQFLERVARIAGAPAEMKRIPRWMIWMAGRFDGLIRGTWDMMYLREQPMQLSDAKLRRLVPGWTPTPIDQAIAKTLESYRAESARA